MQVADILLQIIAQRRRRLGSQTPVVSDGESARFEDMSGNSLLRSLSARRGGAAIAEIKMGSPKLGDLRHRIRPLEQARAYAASGAAALSVVVEPDFFFGSYALLEECKVACGLPTLAKDFLVHPAQVEHAAAAGADAVLLIAALYERDELCAWADLARAHRLVPLVETHSLKDAAKLEGGQWELVGVNNRDLRTFQVDLDRSMEQVERLPFDSLKVAESGIGSRHDVERLSSAGFDAFLIGETLLLAEDPGAKLRELMGP